MDLGFRLRVVRQARRLQQQELARRVGITAKHLSRLETGRVALTTLRCGVVIALARTLGVSTDFLLGLTDTDGIGL